ncbi:PAS domain S-box protein [Acidobacteria bacterium AB60]|nr:PAS domain S-box protein [Acidobacteria bacterium AB60]
MGADPHLNPAMKQDGIWIIDAEGRTLYANDPMAQILGTTTAAMQGKDSFEFVFPEDLEAAQHLFSQKKSGSSAPFTFRLRRADGGAVWVDVQGTPMQNAAGRFIGIVGTFTVAEGGRPPTLPDG